MAGKKKIRLAIVVRDGEDLQFHGRNLHSFDGVDSNDGFFESIEETLDVIKDRTEDLLGKEETDKTIEIFQVSPVKKISFKRVFTVSDI